MMSDYSYSYSGDYSYSGTGDYSYSGYSYTGESQRDEDDYYSYSNSGDYSSYNTDDYDYSDSKQYSTDVTNDKKKPKGNKAESPSGDYYSNSSYSYSYDDSGSKRQASGDYDYSDATPSYSYTYSKSGNATGRGGATDTSYYDETSGSTMTYSGVYSGSYSYSGDKDKSGSSAYSDGNYYDSYSSYSYSDDYKYSKDYNDDYYGSYSDSYSYSYSSDYKYSDGYSGTSKTPDYYSSSGNYDSYSRSKGYTYYDESKTRSQSVNKSLSPTTSSYDNTSERSSTGSAEAAAALPQPDRDLVVLRTPTKELPHVPPPPRRCFLRLYTGEDMVHRFMHQVMVAQRDYEQMRLEGNTPAPLTGEESVLAIDKEEETASEKKKKKSKKSKKKGSVNKAKKDTHKAHHKEAQSAAEPPFTALTPEGYFSQRSVRVALNCLKMNHLERKEILKSVAIPVHQATFTEIVNACAAARVREKVAQAFLAHDTHRCGELPLSKVMDILQRLGIASSPLVDTVRLNVAVSKGAATEPVMTVETRLVVDQPTPAELAAAPMATEPDAVWDTVQVPVCQIVREGVHSKQATSIILYEGNVYMGKYLVCRNVRTEDAFQRIKTYIEAATYACVLVQLFSADDGTKEPKVQYPHLVRSLLMMQPPRSTEDEGEQTVPRKSLFVESLFRTIYKPMEKLAAYATAKGIRVYHARAAMESTLQATQDTEEKRRRNVVPNTTDDMLHFTKTTPSDSEDVTLEFILQKVRLPEAVPDDARCFCLVSTVTSENVFLPAIELPVREVHASKKKGYTWTFKNKKHRHEVVLYVGPAADRLYVECCYETDEPTGEKTVWCAGYIVVPLNEVRSSTHTVQEGSLLCMEEKPAELAVSTQKKKGFFGKLSKKKSKASQTATNMKLEVVKVQKQLVPTTEDMPRRYIIKLRHSLLIAQLRDAITAIGAECTSASQALRQQVVKRIFTVAANDLLLDHLTKIRAFKEKKWTKEQKKDTRFKNEQLLLYVSVLAAMHNCSVSECLEFADLVIHEKPLQNALDEKAPRVAVNV